jgi:hypothetical protein
MLVAFYDRLQHIGGAPVHLGSSNPRCRRRQRDKALSRLAADDAAASDAGGKAQHLLLRIIDA